MAWNLLCYVLESKGRKVILMEKRTKNKKFWLIVSIGFCVFLFLLWPYDLRPTVFENKPCPCSKEQKKIQNEKTVKKGFKGFIRFNDLDSNPDLDFVLWGQEMSSLNNPIKSHLAMPFKYVLVHRDFDEHKARMIKKIRSEMNKHYPGEGIRVIVWGRCSSDSEITQGKYDEFLELTDIEIIYDKEGKRTRHTIEPVLAYGIIKGVVGGVIGCAPRTDKKKKH